MLELKEIHISEKGPRKNNNGHLKNIEQKNKMTNILWSIGKIFTFD